MRSKEHLTELPISIDCSAVSQLPAIANSNDLSNETLLLVSQPGYEWNLHSETATGFISRYAKLEDIVEHAKKRLDIDTISAELQNKFDLSDVAPSAVLSCENLDNPYIISSFNFDGITLSSVEGYQLKDVIIDVLSSQLSSTIPSQLSYHISYNETLDSIVLSNQNGPVISSAVAIESIIRDIVLQSMLSKVEIGISPKTGKYTLYLYFKVGESQEEKVIEITLENIVQLYEFSNWFNTSWPTAETSGHISVDAQPIIDYIGNLSTQTSGDISVLSAAINAEIDRATAAEQANATAIATEETRAKVSESVLSGMVSAEERRATTKEGQLQTAITTEESRAKAAEQANATAIAAEETRATTKEGQLATAISAEETRAKGEEGQLQTAIAAEERRATTKEGQLQTAITTEESRAKASESALSGMVSAEQTRATTKEGQLATAIATEETRATAKEGQLQTAIVAEETRAKGEESTLSSLISAEERRATTKEGQLATAISAEETRAKGEEGQLQTAIAIESAARDDADKALEASAALSVTNLSTEIDDWLTKNAKGYVNQDVTTDNKIATIKDVVGLSGVIHFRGIDDTFISGDATTIPDTDWYAKGNKPIEGDIIINTDTAKEFLFTGTYSATDPAAGKWCELGDEGLYATKQELQAEVARAITAEQANAAAIAAEQTRAKGEEGQLETAIVTEERRATAKEGELETAIAAEKTRAKGEESTLSSLISAEERRATAKEGQLQTVIAAEESRATTKEAAIEAAIIAEETRAKASESELRDAIDDLSVQSSADIKQLIARITELESIVAELSVKNFISQES